MSFGSRMRLGDILLKEGLITQSQLTQALDMQKKEPDIPLGQLLVDMGAITEDTLVEFLGKQFNYPFINNTDEMIAPDSDLIVEDYTSEDFMKQHMVMPLSRSGNMLKVALSDPLDLLLMDNLKVMTSYEISPVIVGQNLLKKSIEAYFNKSKEVERLEEEEDDADTNQIMSEASEGQVVRIVNLLIMQAVSDGASDIHLEPLEDEQIQVRYRVDGELAIVPAPPADLYPAIVSRVKILARLDIAEKRLPQDGAISMKIEGRNIDFRVSTVPTVYGEKIVIRILDKGKLPLILDHLGIDEHSLKDFKEALTKPYGMMLVTGPTGSGKTTTLYACLKYLLDPRKNLLTIEDPVEYKLDGVNQVQVKPEIGLDFAKGLRAFLRQDPDVIMLGEIRDSETAEMSVRAALTGHFVLSTLHTNTAIQSIDRLINMGLDPVMLTSALVLVVAQRLLRRLCPNCKEGFLPSDPLIEKFKLDPQKQIYKAVGCKTCKNKGYKGRLPIHETFLLDEEMRIMIAKGEPTPVIEGHAKKKGMRTLRDCAVARAVEGLTTFEEVLGMTTEG